MSKNSIRDVVHLVAFDDFAPYEEALKNEKVKETLTALNEQIHQRLIHICTDFREGRIDKTAVKTELEKLTIDLQQYLGQFSQQDCDDSMEILYANIPEFEFGFDRFIMAACASRQSWINQRWMDIMRDSL